MSLVKVEIVLDKMKVVAVPPMVIAISICFAIPAISAKMQKPLDLLVMLQMSRMNALSDICVVSTQFVFHYSL